MARVSIRVRERRLGLRSERHFNRRRGATTRKNKSIEAKFVEGYQLIKERFREHDPNTLAKNHAFEQECRDHVWAFGVDMWPEVDNATRTFIAPGQPGHDPEYPQRLVLTKDYDEIVEKFVAIMIEKCRDYRINEGVKARRQAQMAAGGCVGMEGNDGTSSNAPTETGAEPHSDNEYNFQTNDQASLDDDENDPTYYGRSSLPQLAFGTPPAQRTRLQDSRQRFTTQDPPSRDDRGVQPANYGRWHAPAALQGPTGAGLQESGSSHDETTCETAFGGDVAEPSTEATQYPPTQILRKDGKRPAQGPRGVSRPPSSFDNSGPRKRVCNDSRRGDTILSLGNRGRSARDRQMQTGSTRRSLMVILKIRGDMLAAATRVSQTGDMRQLHQHHSLSALSNRSASQPSAYPAENSCGQRIPIGVSPEGYEIVDLTGEDVIEFPNYSAAGGNDYMAGRYTQDLQGLGPQASGDTSALAPLELSSWVNVDIVEDFGVSNDGTGKDRIDETVHTGERQDAEASKTTQSFAQGEGARSPTAPVHAPLDAVQSTPHTNTEEATAQATDPTMLIAQNQTPSDHPNPMKVEQPQTDPTPSSVIRRHLLLVDWTSKTTGAVIQQNLTRHKPDVVPFLKQHMPARHRFAAYKVNSVEHSPADVWNRLGCHIMGEDDRCLQALMDERFGEGGEDLRVWSKITVVVGECE